MSYFDGDQRGGPNDDYNEGDESGRKPFNHLVSSFFESLIYFLAILLFALLNRSFHLN